MPHETCIGSWKRHSWKRQSAGGVRCLSDDWPNHKLPNLQKISNELYRMWSVSRGRCLQGSTDEVCEPDNLDQELSAKGLMQTYWTINPGSLILGDRRLLLRAAVRDAR